MAETELIHVSDKGSKNNLRTTELSIGGAKLKFKTDVTPAILKQVREMVESKHEELSSKALRGLSSHQIALLVAFNLAEELIEEKNRVRELKRELLERTERLLDRVESHLSQTT